MTRDDFVRSDDGHLIVCSPNEEGILVSQVDALPATVFEGYSEVRPDRARLIHGAFRNDDTWFNTRDVMRRDEQGDYWFVGRLHDMLQIPGGQFSARAIEEALCHVEAVRIAAVLLDPVKPESGHSVAAIRLYEGASLDVRELQDSLAALPEPARPRRIYVLDDMPVTNGFRPLKWRVARELQRLEPSFHYRADAGGYS
jgi:acyl-coenzyme A synthetase/AMP-(fatty) acid ligase